MSKEIRKIRKQVYEKKIPRSSLNIRGVRVSLRDQFRSACMDRGTIMRAEILRFMKKYVRNRFSGS